MSETSETDDVRPGEPLPVGAHDPSIPEPPRPPAGTPQPPDETDETLARLAQAIVERYDSMRAAPMPRVLPANATLQDARAGHIVTVVPLTTREALLLHIQTLCGREDHEVGAWADAVRLREESREGWAKFFAERSDAERALFALGIDIEGDIPSEEPAPEPERIAAAEIL